MVIIVNVSEARNLLYTVSCHCDDIACDNCPFKECIKEKTIDMYEVFIEGLAKSLGIEYDKPFKLVSNREAHLESNITSLEFVLKENVGVMINNGSGDTFNDVWDLIIDGDFAINAI